MEEAKEERKGDLELSEEDPMSSSGSGSGSSEGSSEQATSKKQQQQNEAKPQPGPEVRQSNIMARIKDKTKALNTLSSYIDDSSSSQMSMNDKSVDEMDISKIRESREKRKQLQNSKMGVSQSMS